MNGYGEEFEIDIGRLLTALWHKKWLVAGISVLCGLLTLAGTLLFATPEYPSSVMFYVGSQSLADSCIVILETGETLREVNAASGGTRDTETLGKMISAQTLGSTGFFRVTVSSPNAGEAKAIADAVARVLPERAAGIVGDVSLKIADAPVTAEKPGSPDYLVNTMIGILAGFALSAAMISAREIFSVEENGKYQQRPTGREKGRCR